MVHLTINHWNHASISVVLSIKVWWPCTISKPRGQVHDNCKVNIHNFSSNHLIGWLTKELFTNFLKNIYIKNRYNVCWASFNNNEEIILKKYWNRFRLDYATSTSILTAVQIFCYATIGRLLFAVYIGKMRLLPVEWYVLLFMPNG